MAGEKNLPDRYLDGEMSSGEEAAFRERLLEDAQLRKDVEDLTALDAAARALEVLKAPVSRFSSGSARGSMVQTRIRPALYGAALAAACILVGIGLGRMSMSVPDSATRTRTFRIVYYAPDARSVSVLGDFNGWSGEIPLKAKGSGGYWLAEIKVKPGEYRYVLKVDGQERAGDPLADYVIDDDFGSKNSVVRVGL